MSDTVTKSKNVTESRERGDAVTVSPRPWQVRYGDTVADATGAKVAACLRPEDAALIVSAVNLHEYLIEHNKLNAEKGCELFEERDRLAAEVERLRADNARLRTLVGRGITMCEDLLPPESPWLKDAQSALGKDGR